MCFHSRDQGPNEAAGTLYYFGACSAGLGSLIGRVLAAYQFKHHFKTSAAANRFVFFVESKHQHGGAEETDGLAAQYCCPSCLFTHKNDV